MIVELNEQNSGDVWTAHRKADQNSFRSKWAALGEPPPGFPTVGMLEQGEPFGHGSRNGIRWEKVKVKAGAGKPTTDNIIEHNGRKFVEMQASIESCQERERWCGYVSKKAIGDKMEEFRLQNGTSNGITRNTEASITDTPGTI